MKKYRIGVLGLDHWYIALGQLPLFARHPRFELSAVWEPRAWRVRDLDPRPLRVVSRPEDIVDSGDIDLVISLLPCPANARLLARAAANGKAILADKPLGMTVAQCRPLVDAAARRRVVSFSYEGARILSGAVRFARSLVSGGAIGRPAAGFEGMHAGMPQAWKGARGYGRKAWGWWTDPKSVPGGGWIDHAIYSLATFRHLLGDEPRTVSAKMANLKVPRRVLGMEDYGVATYAFRRGAVLTLEDAWFGGAGLPTILVGTEGRLKWGPGYQPTEVELVDSRGARTLKVPAGMGETLPEHLAKCLDGRARSAHPVSEGLRNLEAALAAYRAAKLRREIAIK